MNLPKLDDTFTSPPPRWLGVGAALLVAQLVISAGVDFQLTALSRVAVGALLVGLLLWGSRIAWTVLLLGVMYQLGSSIVDSGFWHLFAGVAITLCLLVPSSIRYVWRTQARQGKQSDGQRTLEFYVATKAAVYSVAYRLIGWNAGEGEQELRRRSYYAGLWRFGIACLVLLLLGGVTVNWHESAGGDSTLLKLVENAIWICYVVAQLAFVVLVVLATRGAIARRHRRTP